MSKWTLVLFFILPGLSAERVYASCEVTFGPGHTYCLAYNLALNHSKTCESESEYSELLPLLCQFLRTRGEQPSCQKFQGADLRLCESFQGGYRSRKCLKLGKSFDPTSSKGLCQFGTFVSFETLGDSGTGGLKQSDQCRVSKEGEFKEVEKLVSQVEQIQKVNDAISENNRKAKLLLSQIQMAFKLAEKGITDAEANFLLEEIQKFVPEMEAEKIASASQSSRPHFLRKLSWQLGPDSEASLPVDLIYLRGHVTLNFPTLKLGSGAFKRVSMAVDYDQVIEKGPSKKAILANARVDLKTQSLASELKKEGFLQVELKKQGVDVLTPIRGGEFPGDVAIIQYQFCDQGTLEGFVRKRKIEADSPDSRNALQSKMALKLLEDLYKMHKTGVIHRDIKPQNILVNTNEKGNPIPILSDFGSAIKLKDVSFEDPKVDLADYFSGTGGFVAPEFTSSMNHRQWRQNETLKKTEVWAAALTLYFLKTGQNEYGCIGSGGIGGGMMSAMELTNYDKVCQLCNLFCDPKNKEKSKVPLEGTFESVVYKMLNPNPDDRLSFLQAYKAMKEVDHSIRKPKRKIRVKKRKAVIEH